MAKIVNFKLRVTKHNQALRSSSATEHVVPMNLDHFVTCYPVEEGTASKPPVTALLMLTGPFDIIEPYAEVEAKVRKALGSGSLLEA